MTPAELDRLKVIAAQVATAQKGAAAAWMMAKRVQDTPSAEGRAELLTIIAQQGKSAHDAARDALGTLRALGAAPRSAPVADPFSLASLADMNAPSLPELLEALRGVLPIAERVDEERGRSLSEAIGGSRGTDFAEELAQLIARLELEMYGPSERVTGGRE